MLQNMLQLHALRRRWPNLWRIQSAVPALKQHNEQGLLALL